MCGISYPAHSEFRNCPIHDVETDYIQDDVDDDWREKAQNLYLQTKQNERRPYPKVDNVKIVEENGRLFVDHGDLFRAGFRPSVLAGGRFAMFELDGVIYELQGWHESGRRWWIEAVGHAI